MTRLFKLSVFFNIVLILGLIITLNHYNVFGKVISKVLGGNQAQATIVESPYYLIRNDLFENTIDSDDEIIFIGDSMTDINEWANVFPDKNVRNMGINGDTSEGVLKRLDSVIKLKPKMIFIMIGINDITGGITETKTVENYNNIISNIKSGSPNTTIFIQSVLPLNKNLGDKVFKLARGNGTIQNLNIGLEKIAKDHKVNYINLYPKLSDSNGELDSDLTMDGLHLNNKGYSVWEAEIEELVNRK